MEYVLQTRKFFLNSGQFQSSASPIERPEVEAIRWGFGFQLVCRKIPQLIQNSIIQNFRKCGNVLQFKTLTAVRT
jgi:hypothetical protein